jgi:hypothetical protein
MTKRDAGLWYLDRFLGLPYVWGGDDAVAGFDCSGLMVHVLQATGVLPPVGDWSAEMLRKRFLPTGAPIPGCLAFRMNAEGKAVHVEMVAHVLADGTVLTIGASGGTSKTKTREDAIRDNAFVKMHPWGGTVFADPFIPATSGDV